MKKNIFILIFIFIFCVFAKDFVPNLHSVQSARQQGFGGIYTTDIDVFNGIYSNPATLGKARKHVLYPALNLNVAGPLADIFDIVGGFTNKDIQKLAAIIKKNNGFNFGVDVIPLLAFGGISGKGFGWAFDTQVFANGSVPGILLSDIEVGVETTFRMGFGFPILNLDNHKLFLGATAKGFAQYSVSYKGDVFKIIDDVKKLPAYLSLGYGLDVGAFYSLCNKFDFAVTCYDAFTLSHVLSGTVLELGKSFQSPVLIKPKLALGAAYHIPIDWSQGFISSFVVRADYRNLLALLDKTSRNPILELSAGTELVLLNTVAFRFGVSEMYPAVGVGLIFGALKIDFAMYGKELGLEPGTAPCLNAGMFVGFTY